MWNWTENQVTIAFIRHGETNANKEHRYLGRTDEPLSSEGKMELLEFKKQNIYPDVDYLFLSPMKRCLQTAKVLYPDISSVVIPEWKEMDFGLFEYKSFQELKGDKQYQLWLDSNGTMPFPEGESRKDFCMRCKTGFVRMCNILIGIIKDTGKSPVTIGAVVHGGTIMALLSSYCDGDYFDYQAPCGGGYLTAVHLKPYVSPHINWPEIYRLECIRPFAGMPDIRKISANGGSQIESVTEQGKK